MGLVLLLYLLYSFRMDYSPLENLSCTHLRRRAVYLVSVPSPNV
jgi:hypothetical protein